MGPKSKKQSSVISGRLVAVLVGLSLASACSNDTQFGGSTNVSLKKKYANRNASNSTAAQPAAAEGVASTGDGQQSQTLLEKIIEGVTSMSGGGASDQGDSSGQTAADQGASSGQAAADQGTSSGQKAADQGASSGQKAADQGATSGQTATDQGASSGQTATDQGATSGQTATDQGATSGQTATDQGATSGQTATDQGATSGQTATDQGGSSSRGNGNDMLRPAVEPYVQTVSDPGAPAVACCIPDYTPPPTVTNAPQPPIFESPTIVGSDLEQPIMGPRLVSRPAPDLGNKITDKTGGEVSKKDGDGDRDGKNQDSDMVSGNIKDKNGSKDDVDSEKRESQDSFAKSNDVQSQKSGDGDSKKSDSDEKSDSKEKVAKSGNDSKDKSSNSKSVSVKDSSSSNLTVSAPAARQTLNRVWESGGCKSLGDKEFFLSKADGIPAPSVKVFLKGQSTEYSSSNYEVRSEKACVTRNGNQENLWIVEIKRASDRSKEFEFQVK